MLFYICYVYILFFHVYIDYWDYSRDWNHKLEIVLIFSFLFSFFLGELEKCLEDPEKLGSLFVKHVSTLAVFLFCSDIVNLVNSLKERSLVVYKSAYINDKY
jgi:hypothetical protein